MSEDEAVLIAQTLVPPAAFTGVLFFESDKQMLARKVQERQRQVDRTAAALLAANRLGEDERDALLRFKQWVHSYLDGKGVPADPGGPHSAEGCRIGDRMDWVYARMAELETAALLAKKEPNA